MLLANQQQCTTGGHEVAITAISRDDLSHHMGRQWAVACRNIHIRSAVLEISLLLMNLFSREAVQAPVSTSNLPLLML